MSTQDLLSILKDAGINFSIWRLNNLVKRRILNDPPRDNDMAKLWPTNTINRIKIFVALEECREKRQGVVSSGV